MENNNQKKGIFRLFDLNRDGKGVEEVEDRKPTVIFFFKLLKRKFTQLIQLNILMLFTVIPIIAAVFLYLGGPQVPTATDISFAPIYGISLVNSTPSVAAALDLRSIQMGLPVLSPTVGYILIGLAVFLAATFGWQNTGAAYVLRGLFRGDGVFVFSDFFYGIKRSFKQAFFLGLIDFAILSILIIDFIFFFFRPGTFMLDLMFFVVTAMLILYTVMRFYLYQLLVTFDLKNFKIIKNALIFTALGIKRNLMALLGIVILLALNIGLLLFLLPLGLTVMLVLPLIYLLAFLGFIQTFAAFPVIDKFMIEPYAQKETE